MNRHPERSLRCYRSRPGAPTRLVCFPHAGGAASFYRAWSALVPADVEVLAAQYPGREDRFDDPLIADMEELADLLTDAVAAVADRRLALFGHSMGGAVAHEVALRLRRRAIPLVHLIVSAREPPQHHRGGNVHLRDDDGVRAELLRLSETNRQLVEHAELWELMLPVIRNDYRLIESYRPRAERPVICPLTAFVGEADAELTRDIAADWAQVTSGPFQVQVFPGDHFYLTAHRATVVDATVASIGRASGSAKSSASAEGENAC
jgi:pyochelin biosynthesis protein PchC